MDTSEILRNQLIKSLLTQYTKDNGDTAILLWEKMAAQVITVLGEDSFNLLFVRSLLLTQKTFPWLAASPMPPQPVNRFTALKLSFSAQTAEQINAANCMLPITCTDIIASLIGEGLTTSILRSAWGYRQARQQMKKNG